MAVQNFADQLKWLEKELDTVNLSHAKRMEFEKKLKEMQNSGKATNGLEKEFKKLDHDIAEEAIRQAESEVSKAEHERAIYQALENVKKEFQANKLTPSKARHEIKEIIRSFS